MGTTAVIPLRFSAVESALRNEAFDHHPSASFCLNFAGQILLVNRAASQLAARDGSDLIGRNIAEFLAVPQAGVLERRWRRLLLALQRQRSFGVRLTLGLAGREPFHTHLRASLFQAEDESLVLLVLDNIDLDGTARLTTARAASSGNPSADGMALLGADRRVLASKGKILSLLGVSSAGAAGVPFEYLIDESSSREFLGVFERLLALPPRSVLSLTGVARARAGGASMLLGIRLTNLLQVARIDGVLVQVSPLDSPGGLEECASRFGERLDGLAEQLADLVFLTDEHGIVAYHSAGTQTLLGLAPDTVSGMRVTDLVFESDRPGLARALRGAAQDANSDHPVRTCLVRAVSATSKTHTLWFTIRNACRDPQLGGMLITAVEVSAMIPDPDTDARQARQLEMRDRLLDLAVQSRADFVQSLAGILRSAADALRASGAGFWRLDRVSGQLTCESQYSRQNHRFLRDWAGSVLNVQGLFNDPMQLFERTPLVLSELPATADTRDPRWRDIRSLMTAPVLLGGEVIGILLITDTTSRHWDAEETGFVSTSGVMIALAVEAAQRVEAEGRIEQLAWYDALTGLPNRNMVRETLRDAITSASARKTRLAVMLIDLDRFKDINDTMGHLVGDSMIRAVVDALRLELGAQASLARLGGDEFLVLLESFPHRHDVAELGERLVRALYRSDFIPNVVTQMSASIGVALFPEHGREVGSLLKNADAAMYQAKKDGRNQVSFFNPIRYERAAQEVRMGIELMKAIQAGQAQFYLEYQPQVDTASGKVVGLEALIRWRHPQYGVLTPDRFIDVAESSGLSDRITNWVIHECCEQILRWREVRPGFDVPISVNVAGRELSSNALPMIVRTTLARYAIEPSMIVLEITERTLVKDGEVNNDVISELNSLGVGLILDDFGTGYSTLSYLRRMPIRAIKIDRSFVKNLPEDADSRALVAAILSLSEHFRLAVVAEGVETQAQAQYLRQQGCDFAQGFLYSRPLLPDRITEQLKATRAPAVKPDSTPDRLPATS